MPAATVVSSLAFFSSRGLSACCTNSMIWHTSANASGWVHVTFQEQDANAADEANRQDKKDSRL